MRRLLILIAAALVAAGCSDILVKETPAPVYYQLEYDPQAVDCPEAYRQGVKIWDFTTASPYDRPEMVAVRRGGQVEFASAFQWVAPPGEMLADRLEKDLSAERLFPLVKSGFSQMLLPLELSGRIYTFAWQRQGDMSRAVLETETSLTETASALMGSEEDRRVLFHRIYRMESRPFEENSSAAFAAAMSDLVRDFSNRLRQDLCQAAEEKK